jgi:hypothetical protein
LEILKPFVHFAYLKHKQSRRFVGYLLHEEAPMQDAAELLKVAGR